MKKVLLSIFALILLLTFTVGLSSCVEGTARFDVIFVVDEETYATVSTGGKEMIEIPSDPTKEGYTFDGWYLDKDFWQKPFTADSLLDAPLSSNISVYAKWTEINTDPPDLHC